MSRHFVKIDYSIGGKNKYSIVSVEARTVQEVKQAGILTFRQQLSKAENSQITILNVTHKRIRQVENKLSSNQRRRLAKKDKTK